MKPPWDEGPREKWDAELEKVNRHGLLYLLRQELWLMNRVSPMADEELLKLVRDGKRAGKYIAISARHNRYLKDPDAYIERSIACSRAAKKAARKRKRERNRKKKEAR